MVKDLLKSAFVFMLGYKGNPRNRGRKGTMSRRVHNGMEQKSYKNVLKISVIFNGVHTVLGRSLQHSSRDLCRSHVLISSLKK